MNDEETGKNTYDGMEHELDNAITAAGSNFAQTAEGVIPFNVWQGGTYKVTFTVEQLVKTTITPIGGYGEGEQTAWRSFMLQGGNSTYKRPESEFCTGNDSETSADEFVLLGSNIREEFLNTTTTEEMNQARIFIHIYKMDESGAYNEISETEWDVAVDVSDITIDGGRWIDNTYDPIAIAYPYSLEDRRASVSFKINVDGTSLGKFNIVFNINRDHLIEQGTTD